VARLSDTSYEIGIPACLSLLNISNRMTVQSVEWASPLCYSTRCLVYFRFANLVVATVKRGECKKKQEPENEEPRLSCRMEAPDLSITKKQLHEAIGQLESNSAGDLDKTEAVLLVATLVGRLAASIKGWNRVR
jgi:hypothetical protein